MKKKFAQATEQKQLAGIVEEKHEKKEVLQGKCESCFYLDRDDPKTVPIPNELKTVTKFWCRRYPTNVLKQANEMCGEFKSKEE